MVGSGPQRTNLLVVRDLVQGGERTLSTLTAGYINAVKFSPDGTRVAARAQSSANGVVTEQLIVAAVAAGNTAVTLPWGSLPQERFTRFRDQEGWLNIRWSPDSKWLAHLSPSVTTGSFEARLFDVAAGKDMSMGTVVLQSPDFIWSPRGTDVALRVTDPAASVDEVRLFQLANASQRTVKLPAVSGARYRLVAWPTDEQILIRRLSLTQPVTGADSLLSTATGQLRETCRTDAGLVLEDERIFGGTGGPTKVDLCLGLTSGWTIAGPAERSGGADSDPRRHRQAWTGRLQQDPEKSGWSIGRPTSLWSYSSRTGTGTGACTARALIAVQSARPSCCSASPPGRLDSL